MFERYTEKARRVIFFARYEASQFGSPYIETEHLLLGLLREDKALTNRFLRSHASVESIRSISLWSSSRTSREATFLPSGERANEPIEKFTTVSGDPPSRETRFRYPLSLTST